MALRLLGKHKFEVVKETDSYIHDMYIRLNEEFFVIENGEGFRVVSFEANKKDFWKTISEFNVRNEIIFVSAMDFEELRLYLKNPKEYAEKIAKAMEIAKLEDMEDEIIDEEYDEDYNDDYDPAFDNFNIDDVESDYYEE